MVRRLALAAALVSILGSAPALAGPEFAAHAASGKSLVVPEAQRGKGTVYYALPGRERMMYFSSDAPAEKIKGQSDQIIGYAIADPKNPAQLKAGEWHLPVASIRTGISKRDEHLQGSPWLDAQTHPLIVFQLKQVKDLTASEGGKSHSATLVGELTMHGITKPLTITDATITVLPAGPETAKVAKGDLLAIRAKYQVHLSDFGVKNQIIGQKVAEAIELDNTIYMSTVPPEEQSPGEKPGKGKPGS
jgi:polyisoprenoid-binding protein YceI